MRISTILSVIPLLTFTLGLPVPGPNNAALLNERDLLNSREIETAAYEERDLEVFDDRSFAIYSDIDERGLDDSPLDFESRSEVLAKEPLFKKETGDVLEPRWAQAIAKGAEALAEGVMALVNLIKAKVAKEKEMRNNWTQWLITKVKEKIGPKWNALVIHPKHDYKFAGVKGKDWFHKHFEFKNSVIKGTTTGYDLYWFKAGEVTSKGDGGFLNWCYNGLVKMKQSLGKKRTRVVFDAPR